MSLKGAIDKSRDIKEKSLKAYMISLKKIHERMKTDLDFDSIKWLKGKSNIKKVMDVLEQLKLPTRKNYMAAILVALSIDKEKNSDDLEVYRNHLDSIASEYYKGVKSQVKSEKLEKNWATMAELKKILGRYKRDIKEKDLNKKEKWSNKDMELYQMWLTGLLYTEYPPLRNDYAKMRVVTFKEFETKNKDDNYLVIVSRNKKYFSLGAYKTKEKYGVKKIDIDSKLNTIINKWLSHNDTGWFLINKQHTGLSDNSLTKLLNKIFSPTGKKIGSTILRHVYLSEKYDPELQAEMKKDSDAMMHSVATQQGVYVKK